MATIGVPLKVLHEAEGHIVTIETTTGEVSGSAGRQQQLSNMEDDLDE